MKLKRRSFFRKLAAASLAFVAAPGVFRALPAKRNVAAVVVRKAVPFWFQTSRRTRCVDAAYAEFFRKLQCEENPNYVTAPIEARYWVSENNLPDLKKWLASKSESA